MHDPSLTNPAYRSLTDQQLAEIDALCERFDQQLVSGDAPRIETFLADAPVAASHGLLAELLTMEIEHRIEQGEEPLVGEYLERFPQQESVIVRLCADDAATEFSSHESISIPVDVPPVLANFRLIEVLGRGGMGVVWLAEQDQPVKRRVALKLVKSELTSRDVIARFDAEKQALAMMDHPNIARVLDAGTTDDGRPYFVMELVDGTPITQYCDDNKLSVDERLKLIVSVCKAVQHAHQKGIVHRDLKPSNVLVTVIDGEAVPKVIDFGLAKAVEHHLQLTDATMQTEFGKVVGTVQYMSPEQAELTDADSQDVDTRTDIYSLGVMLYELLTGSTPLDRETMGRNALLKLLQMIREADPPRPSNRLNSSSHEVNSAVGNLRRLSPGRLRQVLQGELDWVVMKALEKEPDRRYQTANDLAQDLSNYLTGETVQARPPSTWYQVRKFARRNRGIVAALLAVAVALLAGIAGTSYGLIRANEKTRLALNKSREADEERGKAKASEQVALEEKAKAESNAQRAVEAEGRASAEAQRARDAEAATKFQLAVARFQDDRALEARSLLHQVPPEYRDNFEWHYCKRRFQGSDVTCYGHSREVYEAAFTRDGKRVVSAGLGGTIRLWDATTGRQLGTLEGHEGRVSGLAVSPDGSRIASAGSDKTIRLWNAQSGELIREMSGHSAAINCLAFGPTGYRIASTSSDKTVKVWDTATGEELITLTGHTSAVAGVAFSPDGKRIASSGQGDKTVRIWDSRSGEQIAVVRNGRWDSRRVAFCPNGKWLATISYGEFSLLDTQTWQRVATEVTGQDRLIHCVAFSPDGTQLATGADDTSIKLWDTESGKRLATLSGHTQSVWGLAFSPDGSRLVSASRDRTVKIWATSGGNELTLKEHSKKLVSVAFSSDGSQFASGDGSGTVILRSARTSEVLFTLKGHAGDVNELSFSPDGKRLASGGDDGTIRLWNTQTGEEVAVLKGHTSWVRGLRFHPDGTQLASAGWDGMLKLWDVRSYEETATLKGHRSGLYHVAFSPDGSRLATAGSDQTIKLWDAQTREVIRTLRIPHGRVRSVAFDAEGKRLVSAGYEPKVRVWDVDTGELIATGNVSSRKAFGVALSPDGKRMAVGGTDRAVHLFDASSGSEILTFYPGNGGVAEVTFSPDGTRLAAAVHIGTVRIWDAPRKHESTFLAGHTGTVTGATFSRDGSRIYSASGNERLVWDLAARKQMQNASWEPPDETIHTSPDGRWFLTAEANHVVLVDLDYKDTPDEKARRRAKANFDPVWHRSQAKAATMTENWYAAVFHYAWLRRHDPPSLEYYFGLQSSHRRLSAREPAEIEALSRVHELTGDHHGSFYSQQKKQVVATLPVTQDAGNRSAIASTDSNDAIYLDGASYAKLGNLPFAKANFTVEGWIKPDVPRLESSSSAHFAVFTVRSGADTALAAEIAKGRLRVIHRNPPGNQGGINLYSSTEMTDGKCHHFAVVKGDDDILHLYIDGSLEASSEEAAADFGVARFPVVLGMNIERHPRYFIGRMDEIRFWNTARTPDEIAGGMSSVIDPTSPGLVAAYGFDQTGSVRTPSQDSGIQYQLAPIVNEALELPLESYLQGR